MLIVRHLIRKYMEEEELVFGEIRVLVVKINFVSLVFAW